MYSSLKWLNQDEWLGAMTRNRPSQPYLDLIIMLLMGAVSKEAKWVSRRPRSVLVFVTFYDLRIQNAQIEVSRRRDFGRFQYFSFSQSTPRAPSYVGQ